MFTGFILNIVLYLFRTVRYPLQNNNHKTMMRYFIQLKILKDTF